MIPFKLDKNCYYSDTDSLFLSEPLPNKFIGNNLGQFKNQLSNNSKIEEAYFLGVKQYGYWFFDKNNNKIEKSVIAGVERNSLSFETIQNIFNGKIIHVKSENRFFKSIKNLNIKIKDSIITKILFKPKKKLIDNHYIPLTINKN